MLSRRRVLIGLTVGLVAGGCTDRVPALPRSAEPSRAQSASAQQPSPVAPTLPPTRAWEGGAGEVNPKVKAQATRLLEAVGAWSGGAGGTAAARRRVASAGFDRGLVDSLGPLLGPQESAAVQVRDAQYGGILTNSASVLVVVDQWRADPGAKLHAGGTTVDVRLERTSSGWRVVAVHPARPGAAAPKLSAAARKVLADPRIRLPHAARADVRSGRVHDSVLGVLRDLSSDFLVDVSVLRSGHPLLVFGTSRPSDHPRGRAVDVWALDAKPLVRPGNHPLAVQAMRLATAAGAYNVGGPVLLKGREYFSDRTHQDHIHLGFAR